jgi:hypothetical protein
MRVTVGYYGSDCPLLRLLLDVCVCITLAGSVSGVVGDCAGIKYALPIHT